MLRVISEGTLCSWFSIKLVSLLKKSNGNGVQHGGKSVVVMKVYHFCSLTILSRSRTHSCVLAAL